jgi:predicted DNA-binding transcriptional regulator YafY
MPINKSAVARYHIIDRCLTNSMRRYPTLDQIREKIQFELGVSISESMINKDIGEMKQSYQAPIRYDRAKGGYCYTEPDFSIRGFPLREDEIHALDQSIAVLRQIKGSGLFLHFESAIQKIIQGYRINEITGGHDRTYIQVEEPIAMESNAWIEPLLKAIVDQQLLTVSYKGFEAELRKHPFSPYLIRQYHGRWYAVGYSQRSGFTIVLALDRIHSVETSKGAFVMDAGFDPDSYFRHAFGITHLRDATPEKVRLWFAKAQLPYILSQPMHPSQKLLASDEKGAEIGLDVYLTKELVMTILSYGSDVKVMGPDALIDTIREALEGMVCHYKQT